MEENHKWLEMTTELLSLLECKVSAIIKPMDGFVEELQKYVEPSPRIFHLLQEIKRKSRSLEEVRDNIQEVQKRCGEFRAKVSEQCCLKVGAGGAGSHARADSFQVNIQIATRSKPPTAPQHWNIKVVSQYPRHGIRKYCL
jgi:hypothetical protein